jgi:hypothetical protein
MEFNINKYDLLNYIEAKKTQPRPPSIYENENQSVFCIDNDSRRQRLCATSMN